jgi:hypothetical protein
MHAYRAYLIVRDGQIIRRVDLECDDDSAATERAKQLVDFHDIELGDQARKVTTFQRRK